VWATSDGPGIEDFGISEADMARVPRLFVPNHRFGILIAVYGAAAAAVFSLFFQMGHSLTAAAFFTAIVLAAGSVLLLPALVLLLCAGEQAEERWLCRRFPKLQACLAYQRAVAEHRRSAWTGRSDHIAGVDFSQLSHPAFVELLRAQLDRQYGNTVIKVDREDTGYDFLLRQGALRVLLRCESGTEPLPAALGRELAAAVSDSRADAAVILTIAEPTPALQSYIAGRPITITSPLELETIAP
jgi:hypothetical protein